MEDDAGGTYRAVYTVKFKEAVFVLHCFQKKSKLMHCLNRLGYDIEIKLKPASAPVGHLKLAIA